MRRYESERFINKVKQCNGSGWPGYETGATTSVQDKVTGISKKKMAVSQQRDQTVTLPQDLLTSKWLGIVVISIRERRKIPTGYRYSIR